MTARRPPAGGGAHAGAAAEGGAQAGAAAGGPFSWARLWSLFDGTEERLNIAHECVDRHDPGATAVRMLDGQTATFGDLRRASDRFAHALADLGVAKGDPVGVLMEPGVPFYATVFGILKRGAIVVPLYTLFGPDAIRDRLDDCGATTLVVDGDPPDVPYRVVRYDPGLGHDGPYEPTTRARDPAVLQYTSGTTRQLPEAVPHDHRAIVTLARAALHALAIEPWDRYFCPSSPAWGHGLWHGTFAPLSLGVALGTSAGRFDVDRLIDGLAALEITNLAAASTVYRLLLRSGRLHELDLDKASYTGEELDPDAQAAFEHATGAPVCGMYGTTETGVILTNRPPRRGALGRPLPGCEVAVLADDGTVAPHGVTGEISVKRRGQWVGARDLGHTDADGYVYYEGRADDVIISAGWTISPLEVERTLLTHPAVAEAAVVGVPDDLRGSIVKAYVVAEGVAPKTLQDLVRDRLSAHEYPREIAFVDDLPKTPNGKLDRRALRDHSA